MFSGEATPWHPLETQNGKSTCSNSNGSALFHPQFSARLSRPLNPHQWALPPDPIFRPSKTPLSSPSTLHYPYRNSLLSVCGLPVSLHSQHPNLRHSIPQLFFTLLSPKAEATGTFTSHLSFSLDCPDTKTVGCCYPPALVSEVPPHFICTRWFISSLRLSPTACSLLGVGQKNLFGGSLRETLERTLTQWLNCLKLKSTSPLKQKQSCPTPGQPSFKKGWLSN